MGVERINQYPENFLELAKSMLIEGHNLDFICKYFQLVSYSSMRRFLARNGIHSAIIRKFQDPLKEERFRKRYEKSLAQGKENCLIHVTISKSDKIRLMELSSKNRISLAEYVRNLIETDLKKIEGDK